MLTEQVRAIEQSIMSMDCDLGDQVRVRTGLERVVEYLYAAEEQQRRIDQWLYDPSKRNQPSRFPLDSGAALCEAHFFFICWDSIYKVFENLRESRYGFVTPRDVLKRHRAALKSYRTARDHMEHFPERLPGQKRTVWMGDSNSITGSVPGIRRDGIFVFHGQEWDVTERSRELLRTIVTEFVEGIAAEVQARRDAYPEKSAMWSPTSSRKA
jgi:hypothetical protein